MFVSTFTNQNRKFVYGCVETYRYGFNGKENDPESGTQDYGMRIYDPRTGRFLSTDPLFKSFAYKTPYDFAENTPIMCIDLDGGEGEFFAFAKMGLFGSAAQKIANDLDKGALKSVKKFAHGMVQTGRLAQGHGTDKEYVNAAVGIFAQILYIQTPGGHKIVAEQLSKSKNGTLKAVGQNMKALAKEDADVKKAFKEGNAEKIGEVITDVGIMVTTAVITDGITSYCLPAEAVVVADEAMMSSTPTFNNLVEEMGSTIDNLSGTLEVGGPTENTLHIRVDAILKNPNNGASGAVFKRLTEVAEKMAKQCGLKNVEIEFGLVHNAKLQTEGWAREYGYYFSKIEDQHGFINVTWEKPIE